MVRILQLISRYHMKRHLNKIRVKKPSLVEYYAMYLTDKKLRELTEEDIENAERELIPPLLKYYLNPELTWKGRVDSLLHELKEFYLSFCKRRKYLDLTLEDTLKIAMGEYSPEDMLRWCKSPVPRTRYAFWALLKRTRPEDIQRAIELNLLSKEDILEVYRRRKRKLIPAVKEAIEEVLKPQRPLHKKSRKVPKKKRKKTGVFEVYLELTGRKVTSYLERLEVEHEFKVRLANIWFTSQNRKERLRRLGEFIPGLTNIVGYTKLWEYVRIEIDEFILVEALSREQIADYLERNKWRLGKELTGKFERALRLLGRSYM